jgi:hypothetical protein
MLKVLKEHPTEIIMAILITSIMATALISNFEKARPNGCGIGDMIHDPRSKRDRKVVAVNTWVKPCQVRVRLDDGGVSDWEPVYYYETDHAY